jgi:septal ring factor EnvC (AmiA/AmiB activator)
MLLSLTCISTVFAQFIVDDFSDLQAIDRCFQEREILQSTSNEQAQQIADLKTQLTATKEALNAETQNLVATEKMNEVLKREIEATTNNFNQMKDVADRAIKLAESKKSNPLEQWGIFAGIGIIVLAILSL